MPALGAGITPSGARFRAERFVEGHTRVRPKQPNAAIAILETWNPKKNFSDT